MIHLLLSDAVRKNIIWSIIRKVESPSQCVLRGATFIGYFAVSSVTLIFEVFPSRLIVNVTSSPGFLSLYR